MAERSFANEMGKLRLGEGETFTGEGILAVTKALLESGVSYVGGYQGSPISHLLDVLADAQEVLSDYGVRFENSASEATAAATLSASVNYPLRGAITFKSTVGTNVASDALANLASGGVTGGALIIVGEDYGEGSSIMQERSHAFAMKSQIWLLDPRPNLPSIVNAVKKGFELSEASNTPVMLQIGIRSCHLHGQFEASDNVKADYTAQDAIENPYRDINRIVLPPASFLHEKEKIAHRWPAAVSFIQEHQLNEFFSADDKNVGIVLQGGCYNNVVRVLEKLDVCDIFGNTQIPLYVLNVTYPLVDQELERFCNGKDAILVVEQGQPNFIEQNIASIFHQKKITTKLHGKGHLPLAGEYDAVTLTKGISSFLKQYDISHELHQPAAHIPVVEVCDPTSESPAEPEIKPLDKLVNARPPGFCTGCPERPIFTALKMLEKETGKHHVSADIGCHLFSILPPFNIGNTTMGYGLGGAGVSAFHSESENKRAIAVMGDGGFWHNGLTSGIANAVFNKSDHVTVVIDNRYTAATGGQDILSSVAQNDVRSTGHDIEKAAKGVGVKWIKTVEHTYNLKHMMGTLREALTTRETGPKVVVAQSECMLNKQRRVKRQVRKDLAEGKRNARERFGVDPDTCTGDHSCIRLSGCPSLSVKPNPDPLREDPVASVLNSCVGCGLCGEVSHAAVLCPSFYKAKIISHPTKWESTLSRVQNSIIGWLQRRYQRHTYQESV
ncbi:putative indolepyruvate oxidoreductase, IorA subunit [Vibrio nigripulchritudo MADA3029]|uniref:thiamine pyrophosphate-dependent enzyme n=1 Tax=Vibrio nigripulchritudo TaxID=28173 RepID=UPI0003B20CC8|nr:indolepyruvate ferredoxin oxidoreductase subunit alpha [Vibrio nigripulchritudo]CCN48868.1 putative indolepyruvate oxidoreductase, IorA subunit [Vibrio nigripulchritudo MADA3020]CCN51460.1 putative indolepyruvate oxidoreductase, IorA subunit [Vibrio nigripulchritudo MADA3021]CCN57642.1 putative indolepyruvate oxidoreductase, IorA subunit [Vibrio nigripulchritudo MADA3029]